MATLEPHSDELVVSGRRAIVPALEVPTVWVRGSYSTWGSESTRGGFKEKVTFELVLEGWVGGCQADKERKSGSGNSISKGTGMEKCLVHSERSYIIGIVAGNEAGKRVGG